MVYYRQHCAQYEMVCKLLRGRFWGFSPSRGDTLHRWGWNLARRSLLCAKFHPHRCNDKGIGPPKLKFLLKFDQNVVYKRPCRVYPLCNFHKIYRVCTPFQNALVVKISLDLLKGLWSYGGLKLMESGYCYAQIFRPPKVLEVQERARRPLSPCQVWAWTSPAAGAAKNVEFFCLSVCLSVRHAFERHSLCARFRHEGIGAQKRFWCRWIGEGL